MRVFDCKGFAWIIFLIGCLGAGPLRGASLQFSDPCLSRFVDLRIKMNPSTPEARYRELYRRLIRDRRRLTRFLRENSEWLVSMAGAEGEEQRNFVHHFLNWQLQDYQGKPLQRLRDRALQRALGAHGIAGDSEGGRATLRVQSLENKARWMPQRYESSPEMAEVETWVNRYLVFTYFHNTTFLDLMPEFPIFSSQHLDRLKMGTGLNTNAFNRDVLQNDGHVFFFVRMGPWSTYDEDTLRRYGSRQVILDSAYARQEGWISIYVMEPSDLARFIHAFDPTFLDKHFSASMGRRLLLGQFTVDHYTAEDVGQSSSVWKQMAQSLSVWDFTVPDFEELVRHQLLFALDQLRRNSPERFRELVEAARDDPGIIHQQWLDQFVFQPWGLKGSMKSFELKIPVMVPPGAFRVIRPGAGN